MAVMDDVLERIGETERRAGEVVERLQQVASLQQSLAEAGHGLDRATTEVTGLASVTGAAVESLNQALGAFRETVEVIRRVDPAAIREALARIEADITPVREKTSVIDEMVVELRNIRTTIADATTDSDRATRKLIDDAVERLERQTFLDRMLGRSRSAQG